MPDSWKAYGEVYFIATIKIEPLTATSDTDDVYFKIEIVGCSYHGTGNKSFFLIYLSQIFILLTYLNPLVYRSGGYTTQNVVL